MARQTSLIQAVWVQSRVRIVLLLLLLLAVLIAAAVNRWVSEPQLHQLSREQFRLQQQVRQRQVEFANTGVPVSTSARIERNLTHFRERVPPQADFSNFLGELFQWADTAGLKIDQISFQPEPDAESGFLAYGMNFSVTGRYSQLKHFIHQLETSRRILIIAHMALTQSGQRGTDQPVTLQIDLATYFQGGEAP